MEGYKRLASYVLGVVIHDLTVQFVKKWINYKSRTVDQMEQAARSGKQNIAEGYAIDFEDFLRQGGFSIWDKDNQKVREFRSFRAVWVKPNIPNTPNLPKDPEEAARPFY